MGKMIDLKAADSHAFKAYLAEPAERPRGAVVVVQEIFGVNSHIRSVADGYAADGYLVIAPAMFDRAQRGFESGYTQAEIQAGIALMQKVSWDDAMKDASAAVESVSHAGKVGMVGYCWGGRVTYLAGCHTNIAAGVAYYGGGIAQLLPETPRCPMMFHFGEHDSHIPLADVEKIRAAFPQGTYHLYPAGHGFNCTDRADFDAASARLAFERSIEFFRHHLG